MIINGALPTSKLLYFLPPLCPFFSVYITSFFICSASQDPKKVQTLREHHFNARQSMGEHHSNAKQTLADPDCNTEWAESMYDSNTGLAEKTYNSDDKLAVEIYVSLLIFLYIRHSTVPSPVHLGLPCKR